MVLMFGKPERNPQMKTVWTKLPAHLGHPPAGPHAQLKMSLYLKEHAQGQIIGMLPAGGLPGRGVSWIKHWTEEIQCMNAVKYMEVSRIWGNESLSRANRARNHFHWEENWPSAYDGQAWFATASCCISGNSICGERWGQKRGQRSPKVIMVELNKLNPLLSLVRQLMMSKAISHV